ncbi:hypothetical protein ACN261_11925 [Micromonospora sp. WMMD723]|uniref:hypothetical protein n=1 Tax=unclassified Micromonospora TaxID=2617518 RepID=UPI003B9276EF
MTTAPSPPTPPPSDVGPWCSPPRGRRPPPVRRNICSPLHAPRLDPHRPLLPQLALTGGIDPAAVLGALTARPGDAAVLLRRTMYRLLQLTEPDRPQRTDPVPVPRPSDRDTDPAG